MSTMPANQSPAVEPAETVEAKYKRLCSVWRAETAYVSSSSDLVAHPAFRELVTGTETVPFTEPAARAWLGDSVAMSGPSEARFYARSGSNLLMVGQESQSALGIMTSCLTALIMQPKIVGRIDLFAEKDGGVHQGGWAEFLDAIGPRVRVVDAKATDSALAGFAAEVTRRQEKPGDYPHWFLVIDDLSRYRDLRKADDDFGASRRRA